MCQIIKEYKFIVLALFLFSCTGKEKTAYVETNQLFQEYKANKEFNKRLKDIQSKQKYVLDSLKLQIDMFGKTGINPDDPAVVEKKKKFNELLANYEAYNQEQFNTHSTGVWKQINQYLSDYGKANGYTYIHGASGTGSLMYADTTLNITKDVLKYMNQKYEDN